MSVATLALFLRFITIALLLLEPLITFHYRCPRLFRYHSHDSVPGVSSDAQRDRLNRVGVRAMPTTAEEAKEGHSKLAERHDILDYGPYDLRWRRGNHGRPDHKGACAAVAAATASGTTTTKEATHGSDGGGDTSCPSTSGGSTSGLAH